jgi:hypothetical protein
MREAREKLARFSAWWRDRVPFEEKVAVAVFALAALLVGGWVVADNLSSASAGSSRRSSEAAAVEAVTRVVTVHDRGRVVTDKVPVVKRVVVREKDNPTGKTRTVVQTRTAVRTSTVFERVPSYVTHVVTAPPQTVTEVVTKTVPQVEWKVLTVVQTVTITVPSSP